MVCSRLAAVFALIALVFGYKTVINVSERPDGIKIAEFLIAHSSVSLRALRAPLALSGRDGHQGNDFTG